MNVKPIPNALLGERIVMIVPTETGFAEEPIENVRVERSGNIANYSSIGPRNCDEITVWVDYHNSVWANSHDIMSAYGYDPMLNFPVGVKVRYYSDVFVIVERKVYKVNELHHCKFKARRIGDEQ